MNISKLDIKEIACMVSETLRAHGIDAVLVGGACVTIYSKNRYQSYDLDFASHEAMQKIEEVLKKLGIKELVVIFLMNNHHSL